MQIEEQIQKLLRLKAKIDLYKELYIRLDELNKSQANPEYSGLVSEFCDEVQKYVNQQIVALSNVGPVAVKTEQTSQAIRQQSNSEETAKNPIVAKNAQDPNAEPVDPLKFLLKYRHLDGKKIVFTTPDGEVTGTVRGMRTPHLVVETDTGYIANIEPKTVKSAVQ